MIRWVEAQNYRSLRKTRVEFRTPLSALIGPNNSGKSSVLQVVVLLKSATQYPLAQTFSESFALPLVKTVGEQGPIRFRVGIEKAGPDGNGGEASYEYGVAVDASSMGSVEVREEELVRTDSRGRSVLLSRSQARNAWTYVDERTGQQEEYDGNPEMLGLAQLQDRQRHRGIAQCKAVLASSLFLNLQAHAVGQSSSHAPEETMYWTGGNLAGIVERLKGETSLFKHFAHDLSRMIPEVQDVRLRTDPNGGKFLAFAEKGLSEPIPSKEASDGLLRFAAFLAAVHSPRKPALLAIEEPENGLHPTRLEQLVEVLRDYTEPEAHPGCRRQVVLATHSPYLLDWLEPEEVLVVSRGLTGTQVHPVEELDRVRSLLEDASLGDVWYRGSIGGVPAP